MKSSFIANLLSKCVKKDAFCLPKFDTTGTSATLCESLAFVVVREMRQLEKKVLKLLF